jgi:hypothetical protein
MDCLSDTQQPDVPRCSLSHTCCDTPPDWALHQQLRLRLSLSLAQVQEQEQ